MFALQSCTVWYQLILKTAGKRLLEETKLSFVQKDLASPNDAFPGSSWEGSR
jgi:hypothetical protein